MGVDVITVGMQKVMGEKATKMDMEKRGWPYVITYTSMAPADVTTQVLQMKNFNCDYMFSIASEAGDIAWLKELDRQNFHPVIYGFTNIGSQEIWNAVGKSAVGVRPTMNTPQWDETNFPLVSLLHQLNAKSHPEITSRSGHYISGFANAMVVAEALKRATTNVGYENLNGVAVQQALDTIKDFDPGIGVGFTWTPTDHQGVSSIRWYQWTAEGRLQALAADWDVTTPLPEEERTDAWWLK